MQAFSAVAEVYKTMYDVKHGELWTYIICFKDGARETKFGAKDEIENLVITLDTCNSGIWGVKSPNIILARGTSNKRMTSVMCLENGIGSLQLGMADDKYPRGVTIGSGECTKTEADLEITGPDTSSLSQVDNKRHRGLWICRDGKIKSHKYELILSRVEKSKRLWGSCIDCCELLINEEAKYGTPSKPKKLVYYNINRRDVENRLVEFKEVLKKGPTGKERAEHNVELEEVYREYHAKKYMEEPHERDNTRKEPDPIPPQQELNTEKFLAN
ncbi:hypothetical protein OCU04_001953 [Sclerotinia nivalis]|uniref:Uncharacterized protein n=1 Tax=Sclerotinia nivalis TaxID=352851 RepID=A0A9X0B008_9HELO|nr:hypothetical protein OCU04_001953 [Sclerotinia nivalis]